MTANADPDLSTITSPAGAVPEDLPVAEVFRTSHGNVGVKWGEGGAQRTTAGLSDDYTDSFHATDSNRVEPQLKKFVTLLYCDGGTLTIEGTRYRIRATQHQQQANVQKDRMAEQPLKKQKTKKSSVADSLPQPPSKVAEVSSLPEKDRIEISLNGLGFNQISGYVRKDYAQSLPTKFNIGATPSLQEPILQYELFQSFSYHIEVNAREGDRRGFASIVAMPGWGKTYAMTLLAKLVAVCRSVALDNDTTALDNDSKALSSKLESIGVRQDLLRRCVPLAITLNSSMALSLKNKKVGDDDKFYTREIAERLVYTYLADVDKVTFSEWTFYLQNHGEDWSIAQVLRVLRDLAIKAGVTNPIMLLLIDEPDKKDGASTVLSSLLDNALNTTFEVDCRVLMSALEQHWLFTERRSRPINPLKLFPPNDAAVRDALNQGLTQKFTDVSNDDIRDVAEYIGVLASGHWRTISNVYEKVEESQQLTCEGLKLFAGQAPPYVPTAWSNEKGAVMQQLEEALAHAVVGSKLHWMEPIHDGTTWQAVAMGVILQYLGLKVDGKIDAVVPILTVLRLSEKEIYDYRDQEFIKFREIWSEQAQSSVRNALLVKVLGIARFVPSRDVSAKQKSHELFENLAAHFMLLRWDAHARIDRAAKRRWATDAASLMTVPDGLDEKTKRLGSYNPRVAEKLRNETNAAWANSLNTFPTIPPTARPNLWLVPPKTINGELALRLCIFRGAECCTESKGSVKVLPPEPGEARHYTCPNKLLTKSAKITLVEATTEALPSGSVIEPAKGNDGFDSLTVLSKVGGGSAFALIENKFEANPTGESKVIGKLNTLKKYRGVLWRRDSAPKAENLLKRLGLPLVDESDVVWVLLADLDYTNVLADQIRKALKLKDAFQGHVLLTTSKEFFGPCFGRVGILDGNKKNKT